MPDMSNLQLIDPRGHHPDCAYPASCQCAALNGRDAEVALTKVRSALDEVETELRLREGDQPLPVGNDLPVVHELVIEDLRARLALGVRRYGQPLQPFNGRSALRDLYEEILDAAVYTRQAIYEVEGGGLRPVRPVADHRDLRLYLHECRSTSWWPAGGPKNDECPSCRRSGGWTEMLEARTS